MAVLRLFGDSAWQLSSLGSPVELVAALPQCPRWCRAQGPLRASGCWCCRRGLGRSPPGSFARFSRSCLLVAWCLASVSARAGMVAALGLNSSVSVQWRRAGSVLGTASFSRGAGLTAGLLPRQEQLLECWARCRGGRGARLGAEPVPAVGRGRSGNRAAPQACWEPLGPGGRSLDQCTGPARVSLQAGRPRLVPTILPLSPSSWGRGGDQAERWPGHG